MLVQFNLKFTSQFLKKGKKKGNVGMKDSIIFMSATGGYSNRSGPGNSEHDSQKELNEEICPNACEKMVPNFRREFAMSLIVARLTCGIFGKYNCILVENFASCFQLYCICDLVLFLFCLFWAAICSHPFFSRFFYFDSFFPSHSWLCSHPAFRALLSFSFM